MFNSDFRRLCLIPFVLLGMIYTGFLVDLNKSDWAYWVQAIGSFGAILGAYFLGDRQAKTAWHSALAIEDRREQKRLASIFAICTAVKERTDVFRSIFCDPSYYKEGSIRRYTEYDHSVIISLINALNAIPIHEIGNAKAACALLDTRDQLSFTMNSIDALDQAFKERGTGTRMFTHFETAQRNVAVHLDVIDTAYDVLQGTIGCDN